MAEMEEQEMYAEEGENYEDEIPVDAGGDPQTAEGTEELENMKKKLKEMEDEAARLRALQSSAPAGDAAGAAGPNAAADAATKEETDSRSIYVGGVDYACTPEELQQHFQSCGTVNRVTILTDKFGNPKGYAYVEFLEVDAVSNAVLLDNTELRGRNIKVVQKRTNVPGLKARGRGRGRGGMPYMGGRGMAAAMYGMPMPIYGMPAPYAPRGRGGYPGFVPRGRGRGRFFAPY